MVTLSVARERPPGTVAAGNASLTHLLHPGRASAKLALVSKRWFFIS
jgi:hypothetical protein